MAKIEIKGTIVSNDSKEIYDWLGIAATAPSDIDKILNESKGEEVTVEINSGGGDVFAGNEIYYKLVNYPGEVTIDVTGFAGSIASVIAMAGKSRIVPGGMIMIHNVSGGAYGDHNAMEHEAEVLKAANQAIANTYRVKTGMDNQELLDLMDKESWITSDKAVSMGFIDEIINDKNETLSDKKINLTNSFGVNILSQEVVQNLKNKLRDSGVNKNNNSDFLLQQNKAKLKLLNLRRNLNE